MYNESRTRVLRRFKLMGSTTGYRRRIEMERSLVLYYIQEGQNCQKLK